MADTKISALSSAGALVGTEPLPIVQGGVTVKTTVQDVANLVTAGNTNITPIAAASLASLSPLSTTTIYVVTDAPIQIAIQAVSTSQLSQTGQIIDATYSGTVDYDLASNTFLNGTIYDGNGNIWNDTLPGDITIGTGCLRNTFNQNADVTLGNDCINNTFLTKINSFTFGNNLKNVIIESGVAGANYTASPDYDFLYNKDYSATIFFGEDGTTVYHRYFDIANDRIVVTNMATLAVSYIGGGGGGDVYLANDQTFTGENTFAIGSGTKEPIIITKGGNGAGLKVTKSSGSGDAIEVAQGSVSIADETASTIASFDANKRLKSLATSTYPSLTELSYVKGVTSAIQTQINALADTIIVQCSALTLAIVADSSNYHWGLIQVSPTGNDARRGFKFTDAGTLEKVSFDLEQVVNGSNETNTLYLRNITTATDYSIGTFLSNFGASTTYKVLYTGLSIAVNTTDDYCLKIATPAFATNPTAWTMAAILSITKS